MKYMEKGIEEIYVCLLSIQEALKESCSGEYAASCESKVSKLNKGLFLGGMPTCRGKLKVNDLASTQGNHYLPFVCGRSKNLLASRCTPFVDPSVTPYVPQSIWVNLKHRLLS